MLQTKSTAKFNKKSICHECDDRRLVGEDFEDVKKEDLGLNAAGRGLKTCNADLIVELYAYGFTHAIKDETIIISEADCSSRSDDCTSTCESGGVFCGAEGCDCPSVLLTSI